MEDGGKASTALRLAKNSGDGQTDGQEGVLKIKYNSGRALGSAAASASGEATATHSFLSDRFLCNQRAEQSRAEQGSGRVYKKTAMQCSRGGALPEWSPRTSLLLMKEQTKGGSLKGGEEEKGLGARRNRRGGVGGDDRRERGNSARDDDKKQSRQDGLDRQRPVAGPKQRKLEGPQLAVLYSARYLGSQGTVR